MENILFPKSQPELVGVSSKQILSFLQKQRIMQ